MSIVVWVDGSFVEPRERALSALDHGVTVGDGIFETCAVYGGQAFALTRHLRRLGRSAAGMGLPAPDEARIRDGVAQVLAAAGESAGRLRITVTGGFGPMGSGREDGEETIVIAAGPASPGPTSRAVRSPWVRNERSAVAGLKTTSYAENVVALADAVARGGDEAILANTVGELCEGTGANVLVEVGGELLTPPLSSGCLAGITRELLLEWAAEDGLPVREAELPFSVLDRVVAPGPDDGASSGVGLALAGSVRNIQPVVALDGVAVRAGELSLAARELFDRRRRERMDP
ncbi:aminotransferase class IV [Oerskovia enterophila]|uniref:D-alanine aminotransferase n=1 Tax=Oerskovia enterophila TaxID=43678 RepID=A0A165S0X7_9CELL|nr:aminotransferase class IV [Oerskovia enterophila]KZM35402.1 D-alanine aminotransferase [Oerskovia enterophila]OCI29633.1 D-alanine aminotransferase [Oerskovia enterophila]